MTEQFVVPRDRLRALRYTLAGLTVVCTTVMGVAGATFVLWELSHGPTLDAGGYVQDHGGYVLGVPLLLGAVPAATSLLVARFQTPGTGVRTNLYLLALTFLSIPVALAALAISGGLLDLNP